MNQLLPHATIIEQLYHDHHQPLRRYVERLVSEREAAEDVCQETFIKALRHWNTHDQAASVRSWLYRIATNTAYDYLRRQRRVTMTPLTEVHETSMYTSGLESHFADAEPVWAALNRLPEHYRVLLLLQIGAGYRLHDLAATLGCSVDTIKSRLHRARLLFRQLYGAAEAADITEERI